MTDDILSPRAARTRPADVPATPGLWVEHVGSGFVGVVAGVERRMVGLTDDSGLRRVFPMGPGAFRLVETQATVTLVAAAGTAPPKRRFTTSGAVAAPPAPARVARADRILVEGTHDAELIEKVWGDELRPDGVVVEPVAGADNLDAQLRAQRPAANRRIGVLLDHLVPGSKESRIAGEVRRPHVMVAGHTYVDVWQAVRPSVVGLRTWPVVPRGRPWKEGICEALGAGEPALLWRRILGAVRDYRDLEPSLVGAVEQLLDFVLEPLDTRGDP